MSLLDDIGLRLENQSVGTVTVDIFQGRMPPTPPNAISLHEVIGQAPRRVMGRRSAERPNVRVLARGATYDEARALATEAFEALDGFVGTLNGTRYMFIEALSSLIHLGPDEQEKRHQFSCTYRVTVGA